MESSFNKFFIQLNHTVLQFKTRTRPTLSVSVESNNSIKLRETNERWENFIYPRYRSLSGNY